MPASDLTLYAKWDLNSYTITFNSLGGSSVEPLTVNYNEAIIAPEEPTRTGYTFSGWYSDESLTNLFIFTSMPASDLTLYAKWDINSYTVTFNSLGGSNVEALRVNYNEAIIGREEVTRTGYSFSGWYSDINLTNLFIFTSMPASDLTLYAKWDLNSYTVTFNSLGGSNVEALTVNYNEAIIAPEEPTRTGYTFSGWFSDESLTNEYIFTSMPANNITLYAGWIINTYVVKFYNDDNTFLSEVVVNHGSNANFQTPTKESTVKYHYEFSGWSLSVNNVISDLTVYATYNEVLRSYTVIFYSKESSFVGDNPVLKTNLLPYGSLIDPPSEPIKESTAQYSYIFSG